MYEALDELGMVVIAYSPSTQKAKMEGSEVQRSCLTMLQIQRQSGVRETLSLKYQEQKLERWLSS